MNGKAKASEKAAFTFGGMRMFERDFNTAIVIQFWKCRFLFFKVSSTVAKAVLNLSLLFLNRKAQCQYYANT